MGRRKKGEGREGRWEEDGLERKEGKEGGRREGRKEGRWRERREREIYNITDLEDLPNKNYNHYSDFIPYHRKKSFLEALWIFSNCSIPAIK